MVKTLHLYPPETLALLLDCGLDFAQRDDDDDGDTPLMCAVKYNFTLGATGLLGLSSLLGRDVALGFRSTDLDGCNVLHLAVAAAYNAGGASEGRDSISVLELLLAHPGVKKATANARDHDGHTPLHTALLGGDFVCASTLLGSPKVFRGSADNWGNTPLHCLFMSLINTNIGGRIIPGVDGLLWKLLRWQAGKKPAIDIFATNDDGLMAMDLAFWLGHSYGGSLYTLEIFMHWREGQRARKRRRG